MSEIPSRLTQVMSGCNHTITLLVPKTGLKNNPIVQQCRILYFYFMAASNIYVRVPPYPLLFYGCI